MKNYNQFFIIQATPEISSMASGLMATLCVEPETILNLSLLNHLEYHATVLRWSLLTWQMHWYVVAR